MTNGSGEADALPVKRGRPSSRERIVEAAGALVQETGAAHLSLDAVAERAGISKGGLLYNFPTKTDLLKALVAKHIVECEIGRAEAEEHLADGPNRAARAFVAAARGELGCKARPPAGVLAAIAENPGLIEPVRARNASVCRAFSEADDPMLSLIAFLVVEGMTSLDLLEVNPLAPELRTAVLDRMDELLRQAGIA